MWAGIVYSIQRLALGWMAWGSNPVLLPLMLHVLIIMNIFRVALDLHEEDEVGNCALNIEELGLDS